MSQTLAERLGRPQWERRLLKQRYCSSGFLGGRCLHFKIVHWGCRFLSRLLHATGLYEWGNRNFKDVRVRWHDFYMDNLPAAFEGYRLLQLTDLHLDLDTTLTPILIERLRGLEYDICVMTGDFRDDPVGDASACLAQMGLLMEHIKAPTYAVLGNHDFMEMVPPLEAMGIRVLLNETIALARQGEAIYLSGVDDPGHYQTDDIARVSQEIPSGQVSILLSHDPCNYQQAGAAGFDLMLAGHTHGGQICLPGGIAVLRVGPWGKLNGKWKFGNLQGYTSPGTGACGVPVRYFCPPEMTIHRLLRAAGSARAAQEAARPRHS